MARRGRRCTELYWRKVLAADRQSALLPTQPGVSEQKLAEDKTKLLDTGRYVEQDY